MVGLKNQVIIKDTSGNEASIFLNGFITYSKRLNLVNNGAFNISIENDKRSLFEIGSTIYIFRNGSLDWKGIITRLEKFSDGTIGGYLAGQEIRLCHENGTYPNSPYPLTASATIASDIIGESSFFSAGTIDTGLTIDFRIEKTSSIWNALKSLISKTSQDIGINYSYSGSDTISVLDHLGSSSSVLVLNDNVEITNVQASLGLPLGNFIRVFGKGDGTFQAYGEASDSASISTYGKIEYTEIDPKVMSNSEANALATALLARFKNPTKFYDFNVVNPDLDITLGDVITINAPSIGLTSEAVRITEIKRKIFSSGEVMSVKVSDTSARTSLKKIAEIEADLEVKNRDYISYMQGSGNLLTWSGGVNAKSGASLKLPFYISSSIMEDESGATKISSFTIDYDIDPFRSGVGSASEDSVAVDVSPASFNSHNHNASDSGHDHSLPTMTSSVALDVLGQNTSGYDYDTEFDLSGTSWTTINTFSFGGYEGYECLHVHIDVTQTDGSAQYAYVRVEVGSSDYFPNSSGARLRLDEYQSSASIDFDVPVQVFSGTSSSFDIQVRNGSFVRTTQWNECHWWVPSHKHSISGYSANTDTASVSDDNISGGLSGNSASHDHNVSIGDDVSESGGINASSVNIYLDYWNGSSWTNKHSILSTGKTIDTDVDLSDGGTYPDTTGYWRIRLEPNSSSPDYAQAIVKIKHHLDN